MKAVSQVCPIIGRDIAVAFLFYHDHLSQNTDDLIRRIILPEFHFKETIYDQGNEAGHEVSGDPVAAA